MKLHTIQDLTELKDLTSNNKGKSINVFYDDKWLYIDIDNNGEYNIIGECDINIYNNTKIEYSKIDLLHIFLLINATDDLTIINGIIRIQFDVIDWQNCLNIVIDINK